MQCFAWNKAGHLVLCPIYVYEDIRKMEGFILLEMCMLHMVHTCEQHKRANMISKAGFEAFTAVLIKSPICWDIRSSFHLKFIFQRAAVTRSLSPVIRCGEVR
jgi:hypothetical protein